MTVLYVNLTTIPNNIDSSLGLGLSNILHCTSISLQYRTTQIPVSGQVYQIYYIVRQSHCNTEQHRFQSQAGSIKYTTLYVNLTTIPKNIDSSLRLGLSNILHCTSISLQYRTTQIPVSSQVYQIHCIVCQFHYNTEPHRFQSCVRSIKYIALYVNLTTIPNYIDSSLGLGLSNTLHCMSISLQYRTTQIPVSGQVYQIYYIVRQSHYNTEQHRFQSRVRSIKYTTLYVNLTTIPNNIDPSLGLGLSNILYCTSFSLEYRTTQIPVSGQVYQIYCIVRQSHYNTEQHKFQSRVRSIKYTTLYINLTTIPNHIDSSLGLGLSNILHCTSISLQYRTTQIPVSGQFYQIYYIVRQSHYNTEQHRFQSQVRFIKYTTLYVNLTTIPNNIDSSLGLGLSNILHFTSISLQYRTTQIPVSGQVYQLHCIVCQSHYNTEQIDSSLGLGLSNILHCTSISLQYRTTQIPVSGQVYQIYCIVRQSHYNVEQHRFQSQVRSIKYTALYVNFTTIPNHIDSSLVLGLSNILHCTSISLQYRTTQIPVSGQVYQIYCTVCQTHQNTEQHRFQSRVRSIKFTALYVNLTTIPNNIDSSLELGLSNILPCTSISLQYRTTQIPVSGFVFQIYCIVRQSHYNTKQHRFQSRVRSHK